MIVSEKVDNQWCDVCCDCKEFTYFFDRERYFVFLEYFMCGGCRTQFLPADRDGDVTAIPAA